MLYKFLRALSKFLLKLFCKIEVKGKDVFPSGGHFILASNHISNLDPVLLGVVSPYVMNYIAKEELFKNKLFGFIMKKINVIPFKRGSSDIKALRTAVRVLKKKNLVIFPQGTRGMEYSNFKLGVGFLHKKTGAPLIVAKIYGSDSVLPKGAKFMRKGKLKVIFAPVDNINEGDTYEEVSTKVIEKIKSL